MRISDWSSDVCSSDLSNSGLSTIEAGSFVSPQRIPQMADTEAVLAGIGRVAGVRYPVLVPNVTGMERAIAAGIDEVAVFLSTTESFSQRNINRSEEHTSELQSLMRISYAVFCLKKKIKNSMISNRTSTDNSA